MMHPVFVIEDDPDIRDSLLEVLEEHGHATVSAAHGRQALDKLRALPDAPCVILLDLMMPVMDGRAFRLEQLQDPELSKIPVVVISAYHDTSRSELRAAAYLNKPVKLAQLLDVVAQYCPC